MFVPHVAVIELAPEFTDRSIPDNVRYLNKALEHPFFEGTDGEGTGFMQRADNLLTHVMKDLTLRGLLVPGPVPFARVPGPGPGCYGLRLSVRLPGRSFQVGPGPWALRPGPRARSRVLRVTAFGSFAKSLLLRLVPGLGLFARVPGPTTSTTKVESAARIGCTSVRTQTEASNPAVAPTARTRTAAWVGGGGGWAATPIQMMMGERPMTAVAITAGAWVGCAARGNRLPRLEGRNGRRELRG